MLPKNRHREEVFIYMYDCMFVGTPQSFTVNTYDVMYFRALEVWGSWQVLQHELKRRRSLAEEEEKRRKGLGALIVQLKKYNKTQTRKEIDTEVC